MVAGTVVVADGAATIGTSVGVGVAAGRVAVGACLAVGMGVAAGRVAVGVGVGVATVLVGVTVGVGLATVLVGVTVGVGVAVLSTLARGNRAPPCPGRGRAVGRLEGTSVAVGVAVGV
jgi:hypothetical protein